LRRAGWSHRFRYLAGAGIWDVLERSSPELAVFLALGHGKVKQENGYWLYEH
jgi:hypothetical protein